MDVPMRDRRVFRFGPYTLDPTRRTLRTEQTMVALPARLFDTLLCLVEAHDRVVRHDELERAVWPGRNMDPNNVGQAISSLRRALLPTSGAEPVIVTTRQGYRLALPVSVGPYPPPPIPVPPAATTVAAARHRPWTGALRHLPVRWLGGLTVVVLLVGGLVHILSVPSPHQARGVDAPPVHSVAVLAFDNLSGDARQDYFSDGLSEELIDSLGSMDGVRVAARQSAFSFKGRPVIVADIARQLNVASVLEGSVRQDGDRLRIDVRLIDAATGFEVWSRRYDRDRGALLRIQSEVAASVAQSLRVALGTSKRKIEQGGTTNPAALDWYLRGLKLVHEGGGADMQTAIGHFDAALRLDGGFARARMERAVARAIVSDVQDEIDMDGLRTMQDLAMQDARQAVALAPDLGLAHAVLGRMLREIGLDFPHAAAEIRRARELAPGDTQVLAEDAMLQFELGHTEAGIAAAAEAVSLDPLSADAYRRLAGMLNDTGRFAEAVVALHHAEQLVGVPSQENADLRSEIDLATQDLGGARALCAAAKDWQQLQCLAIADQKLGRAEDARADLLRLHAMLGDTGACQYAEIAAQAGRMDEAAAWLQTAFRLRDPGLADLKTDRLLTPLRGSPAYAAIERALFAGADGL